MKITEDVMSFDLEKILESERALRRTLTLRGSADPASSDATALRETPPLYPAQPK